MSGIAKAFLAFERRLTDLAMATAGLALVVAVAAGLYQVLSRFLLQQPATWSEALVRTALIWMGYLGLTGAFRAGALVSIDLCHRLTGGWVRRVIEWIMLLCSLWLLCVMVWFGYEMAMRVRFQNLAGLEVSIAWAYAAIPLGAAFCIVSAVANFLDRRQEELDTAL